MSVNFILNLYQLKSLNIEIDDFENIITKFKLTFYQEMFDASLELINLILAKHDLSENTSIFLNLNKLNLFNQQENISSAFNLLNELEKNLENNTEKIFLILFNILKAYALILSKKKKKPMILLSETKKNFLKLQKIENFPIFFQNDIFGIISLIKGNFEREQQNLDSAIKFYEESIKLRSLYNKIELGLPYYLIGRIYQDLQNYNQSINYFNKSIEYFSHISINGHNYKNSNKEFGVFNNTGLIFWKLGDLDKALIYYKKAMTLFEVLNDRFKGVLLSNIGLIYFEKGELNKSLEYTNDSMEIFEKIDNKPFLSKALNNIGNNYYAKGETELSLSYYNRALNIAEEIGDRFQYGTVFNNIGELYQSMGEFEKSYFNYNKSLEIFLQMQSKAEISFTLHNLINISLLLNNEDEVDKFLKELEEIKALDLEKSKIIELTYLLSLANTKKHNKRFSEIGEAQKIYYDIIRDDIVKYDFTVESILQLCEILLLELKFSGKESVLSELTDLVEKLQKIANEQKSFLLQCHSFLLASKISILNFDPDNIEKSTTLLRISKKTAEEQGYKYLASRISFEIEAQQRMMAKINSSEKDQLTFDFLIELTEIESYVSKIIKNNIKSLPIDVEDEEPRLLLLIARSGIPFYAHSFGGIEKYDSSLISGFLTAMNSFFQETFSTDSPIERIGQKDYTILFRNFDQITYCYVFKGSSLKAVNKFETFISTLLASDENKEKMKQSLITGISLHRDKWINEQVRIIFKK